MTISANKNFLNSVIKNDTSKIILALFVLCAFIGILRPYTFLTIDNFMKIMSQTSVNGIMVVGMSFILLTGGIDLSVGSVAAFSSLTTAVMLTTGSNIITSVLCGLLIAILIGIFSGLLVSKLMIPPFIVTLSMLTIFRGATIVMSQGRPITKLGDTFGAIGTGYIGPIPVNVVIMIIFFLSAFYVLNYTKLGKHIYAVGGNKEAARLSGINVSKTLITVYSISALCACVSGFIMASRVDSATPTAGEGAELDAIAAAVIGGMSLTGGKGKILGAFIGALIIGVLNNGLILLGIDVFWIKIVKGIIILLAVVIDVIGKGNSK